MHVALGTRASSRISHHHLTRLSNARARLSLYCILQVTNAPSYTAGSSLDIPFVPLISRHLSSSSSSFSDMEPNGDVRYKRKNAPVNHFHRPTKLFKTDISKSTENVETSPQEGYDMETDTDDGRLSVLAPATADSAEWQATIEKVVRNVVSIHYCQTCSFDTDAAVSTEATGFVVDAERGYILTNRHVVGAGPFWGYCIFDNHEEVG